MPDLGIYTKNADIKIRAGANVDATMVSITETDKIVLVVEAYINALTRHDWSTAWTAAILNANQKALLTEIGACMCAQLVIQFDMTGAPLLEMQTRLDVLDNRYKVALKALREDDDVKTAVGKA